MEAHYYANYLYPFINKMAPIYILKLDRSPDILSPQISMYVRGMDVQCISFKNVIRWTICRTVFPKGDAVSISLNRHFIAAQRIIKSYCKFLIKVKSLKFLREREETGKSLIWRKPRLVTLYADCGLLCL